MMEVMLSSDVQRGYQIGHMRCTHGERRTAHNTEEESHKKKEEQQERSPYLGESARGFIGENAAQPGNNGAKCMPVVLDSAPSNGAKMQRNAKLRRVRPGVRNETQQQSMRVADSQPDRQTDSSGIPTWMRGESRCAMDGVCVSV
jgi:hypothetical protein